jgi:hypothetical protein
MNTISKSIKPRLEKDLRNLKSWILLWNIFGFKSWSVSFVRKESAHPLVMLFPNLSLHLCMSLVRLTATLFAALAIIQSTSCCPASAASSWCRPRAGGLS